MKKPEPQPEGQRDRRWFWPAAGLVTVLLASTMVRDIRRPITGLHSWALAERYWSARSHVKYGLGYTKGYHTYVVGDPPPEKPTRWLDHPQVASLHSAIYAAVFGFHDWTHRVAMLVDTAVALLILTLVWPRLFGQPTALLAGLLFVLFPHTGYFGVFSVSLTVSLLNLLTYLPLARLRKEDEDPPAWRLWALAGTLFLGICFSWLGVGWAFAIGLDYVIWCIRRRQWPRRKLLAVMIAAPAAAILANYLHVTAGRGWDFGGLFKVYLWRSGFQSRAFDWGAWFQRLGEFAVSNFTWPVLILALVCVVHVIYRWLASLAGRGGSNRTDGRPETFPLLLVFLVPGLFQLFVFRDALWYHQFWLAHLVPFMAIAAALGVMVVWNVLKARGPRLAVAGTGILLAVVCLVCMDGLNHYFYDYLDQSPKRVEMMQTLRKEIPPDKALLSIQRFMVEDHPSKGAHMRPEIAWYLDRRIVQPKLHTEVMTEPTSGRRYLRIKPEETTAEARKLVEAGEGRYFLVPRARFIRLGRLIVEIAGLVEYLTPRYRHRIVPGDPPTPEGKRWLSKMGPQVIFDMKSGRPGP